MRNIHLCAGDIYLTGYENCDHNGYILSSTLQSATLHETTDYGRGDTTRTHTLDFTTGNPNKTTLDHYFIRPFEKNSKKRPPKVTIIDTKMDILKEWPWKSGSVDTIVSISAFEHFEHLTELPHIIKEAHRVLKRGGIWKFDFPDIKQTVEDYYESAPEFCMELIYCNHKDKYSVHQWGYNKKSVVKYVTPNKWKLQFKEVVTHDYPMIGVWATKI